MKRGLIVLLVLLFTIPYAFGSISVILHSPGTFTTSTVTLNCTGSVINYTEDGNLGSNVTLLFSTGTPELNTTITSAAGTSYAASFTVYNVPNGVYNWNCRFYNQTADNSVNNTGTQGTFTVNVPAVNTVPNFTGAISNQSFAEDGSLSNAFDLDSYFSDSATTTLAYSVFGNSSISVAIASDGQVSFLSTGNVSVNETIYFVASDGSLTNRSNNVLVTVYSLNDAPYLKSQIPSQNWSKNMNLSLTLSDYFADVEGNTLNYSVTTSPSNINVTISVAVATLVPSANWTGTATIVFAANDSKNITNSNTVTLNVITGTNTAPLISDYSPSNANVNMKSTESVTFSVVKSDADGNALTVQWYLNDAAISGATADSYQLSNPKNGSHTLKVIVSDSNSSVQKSWTVNVLEAITLSFSTPEKVETASLFNADGSLKYSVCGNGIIDAGEDCSTCIDDVKCGENEVCINALCEKKKNSGWLFGIVGLVSLVIILLVFGLYKLNASRHPLDNRPRDAVRKFGVSNMELKPASEIKDYYHKGSSSGSHDSKMTPLRKEIADMRNQGLTDQEIVARLRAKGWPKWQVETRLREK